MVLIIAQIIGLFAVSLYLLSYQLKKRSHIVWVTCVANGLYVLQYLLLGAYAGAVMDVVSTVASFCAAQKDKPGLKKYAKLILFVNMALIVSIGLAVAIIRGNPIELLPIGGAFFPVFGLFFDREQTIRKFGLLGAPFWLIYNFITRAYGASVGSAISIVSIIVSLIRYRQKKPKNA